MNDVTVSIDVQLPDSLLQAYERFHTKLPKLTRKIALAGKSFWKNLATKKLKASRNAYVRGIDMTIVDASSFYLVLDDPLAVAVEAGSPSFDMKPGLLRNATIGPPKRRKIPRALAAALPPKSSITRYRIVPLNPGHVINLTKPKVFRIVSDKSPASSWIHPGWKGINLAQAVVAELTNNILPKEIAEFLKETL